MSLKTQKAKLQKELNAIAQQEHEAMIAEWLPKFKAQFEAKYFKCRNSYGSGDKGWWLYTKVTSITADDVYDTGGNGVTSKYSGWSFQVCSDNRISIEQERRSYMHSLDKEITETEFNDAWNKMIDRINAIQ